MVSRCGRASEAVLLAMACLSPWAFGAVRAWAEAGIYLGVFLVAVLGAVSGQGADRPRRLVSVPGLALGGLIVLALVQAAAWPGRLVGRVVPSATAFKAGLAPGGPERVDGDPGPAVEAPALALSQCPEMTFDAAMRLAAGWALFQAVLGLGGGPGVFRRFGVALAVNAALVALLALVQMLSWNGRMYWVSGVPSTLNGGPFFSKNHLAAYLNLGLGFALSALFLPGRESRGLRFGAAYVAGLIAVGVIASVARGGFVGMMTATMVLLFLAKPAIARVGVGLAVMLGVVALFLASAGAVVPYQRIATLFESESYVDRVSVWKMALLAWSQAPVWGLGLGTFSASGRFFDRDEGCFVGHAESEYLEMLADGGVIGLALALLILIPVVRLGLRALAAAPEARDRAPILGGLFGVVALATQCLSDFPLHIPAIAVVAVMLGAHLTRAGLAARGPSADEGPADQRGGRLANWGSVALSLLALWHGVGMARSEAVLLADGLALLPQAGYAMPTAALWDDTPMPTLEQARAGLEGALRHRPDWAEGHARLGIVLLSQYQSTVRAAAKELGRDPKQAAVMANPIWLQKTVHTVPAEQIAAAGGVLGHELVRRYLVPAARCFLEARRCCPVWGLPHAELASLDYLLLGRDSASTHARRALRLAGPDGPTISLAAQAAGQAGDLKLAAQCWQKLLQIRESYWTDVADECGAVLTPEQVLEWVIPDGRYAVLFADRLYAAPGKRPARDRFLRWASERLPTDRHLPEADRLQYEALALAGLDQAGPAETRMTAALALEPHRGAWRKNLVEWLIARGKFKEAHDQATLGLYFTPDDLDARKAAELAAEALARGLQRPEAQEPR
jgi:tetratricopeptide (TPR) repeat protein